MSPSKPPPNGSFRRFAADAEPSRRSRSRFFAAACANGTVEVDAEVALQRLQRFAHQLAVALAPTARSRRRRATAIRRARSARGSKSYDRAEALAVRAGAVRRVERERARRHLRHAEAAVDARQPPREQPVAAVERVDDDDVVGEVERGLDRFGQPALDAAADDQPIDDDFDGVVAAAIELDVLFERAELAVDARLA